MHLRDMGPRRSRATTDEIWSQRLHDLGVSPTISTIPPLPISRTTNSRLSSTLVDEGAAHKLLEARVARDLLLQALRLLPPFLFEAGHGEGLARFVVDDHAERVAG